MTTSDIGLLDTNVLVYAADEASPFHHAATALRDKGFRGETPVCVCPQVLHEFFAVITDPKRVTNPLGQKDAQKEIEKYFYSKHIVKIFPEPEVMEKMFNLLTRYKVAAQEIFDLRLVATMISNNVSRLYTYNTEDFAQYKEIEVVTP